MARTTSIRQSLLRNLALVILVLSGAVLAATVLPARHAIELLSRTYIEQVVERTNERLRGFFGPLQRELEVAAGWGKAGLLDAADPEDFVRLFVPVLRGNPSIGSALVADAGGRELMLLRSDGGWQMRESDPDRWGRRTLWREWRDASPEPQVRWKEIDYDARRRPWFVGALGLRERAASGGGPPPVFWTEPYAFFTTGDPGMSIAVSFEAPDGRVHVLALDVSLRDISDFTRALSVSERGRVFVVDRGAGVIGLPRDPRFDDPDTRRAALLAAPDALSIPEVAAAVDVFRAGGRPFGRSLRFESGGEPWWVEVKAFALSPGRSLWVGVLIPEVDFLGDVTQLRLWIGGITLAVLALGLLLALRLAGRTSKPIELLAQRSIRIGHGDLEPSDPIRTSVAEVKRLAEAQDRMRVALRTLLKLERDLQLAREIQQGTFPTRLPALPGFAVEGWSEPADETCGDTYDVIGVRGKAGAPLPDLGGEAPERAVLLLADAAGHGIGPALSATQVRAMLRMAVRSGESLAAIVAHLNGQLGDDLPAGRFITAWLAELDAGAATLTSFSAGQAPILHYRAAADAWDELDADSPPLGVVPALDVEIRPPLHLEPGDLVAVLSDGIYEAVDADGRAYGVERVEALLRDRRQRPAAEIAAALRAALAAFSGGRPAADDRTGILIQRLAS